MSVQRMRRLLLPGLAVILIAASNVPHVYANPVPDPRVGDAQQVIVVEADLWSATEGTLTAFERDGSIWRIVQPEVRAQLGYGGLVRGDRRRQGTGTTPTGIYEILSGFGRKTNPGTELEYIRLDRNDVWPYDPRRPRTYNVFQNAGGSWRSSGRYVEYLWNMGLQYNYVAVLDYNLPQGPITTNKLGIRQSTTPPNTSRGGGIFLHVDNGNKTAGCIAVKESVMRDLMRWLDPAKNPLIVIRVGAR